MERPKRSQESNDAKVVETYAQTYSDALGLDIKTTSGKVLDLGGGSGGFAKALSLKGIKTVSFDHNVIQKPFAGVTYIRGDAFNLDHHFPQPQFDLVVAREAVKFMVLPLEPAVKKTVEKKRGLFRRRQIITIKKTGKLNVEEGANSNDVRENFTKLFSQVRKVLKDGGEFRFDARVWADELYLMDHPDVKAAKDVDSDAIFNHAKTFLKSIDPSIEMHVGKGLDQKPASYFVLKKAHAQVQTKAA